MIDILIYISLILFLCLILTLTNNAVYALIALILQFLTFAMLLTSFNLPFLALSYVLVYIGAICVLFVYILLLLHFRRILLQEALHFMLFMFCVPFMVFSLSAIVYIGYSDYNLPIKTILNGTLRPSNIDLYGIYAFEVTPIYTLLALILLGIALLCVFFLKNSIKNN